MMPNVKICQAMTQLQNSWYSYVLMVLGLDAQLFQIVQPAPVIEGDTTLWSAQNQVPPFTLTANPFVFAVESFFDVYALLVDQLALPESRLEQDIGPQNFAAWQAFLQTLSPPPPQNQLPNIFRNWAALNAPSVANIGSADLSKIVLLDTARNAITPYKGENPKPIDYQNRFDQLKTELVFSSAAMIEFDSQATNDDVSASWADGINPQLFGLWSKSWCARPITQKFADSRVRINGTFGNWALVTIQPGPWYQSAWLGAALRSRGVPPWRADSELDHAYFFGDEGRLLRAMSTLIVVDNVKLTLTSDAVFTVDEQQQIQENVHRGIWPLYTPHTTQLVTFPNDRLAIEIMLGADGPLVLGRNVLEIGRYVGR